MQRDVKIGIAIGVLLILLIGIFWLTSRETAPQAPAEEEDISVAQLPPSEFPVAPEEHGSPYLSESPEVAVAPPRVGPAGPSAPAVNPQATLQGPAAPPAVEPPRTAPATTLEPPSPAAPVFHTIKSGDTLSEISQKYYGTTRKWKLIQDANPDKIPDPNRLKIGVRIVIPNASEPAASPEVVPVTIPRDDAAPAPSRKHTVVAGESLSTIAEKYYDDETKWRKIYDANRNTIQDPNRLRQGMELVIP